MEMTGEHKVPAPTDQVWQALNDPEKLKSCIAGCESIEAEGENAYRVSMAAKVGPVSARFSGTVKMENIEANKAYTLRFQGSGAAGFVNGEARVTLTPTAATQTTTLVYVAKAQVGGKLAQVGQRLIDGAAHKMADDFFSKFTAEMELPIAAAPVIETTVQPQAHAPPSSRRVALVVGSAIIAGLVAAYLLMRG